VWVLRIAGAAAGLCAGSKGNRFCKLVDASATKIFLEFGFTVSQIPFRLLMMPLKEQILKLVTKENGLTDREITDKLRGLDHPQQPVNQACLSLARNGKLIRRKREDGRIVNFPLDGLKEQILKLVTEENGLTDREITNKLCGLDHPQQPVNQACRSLARNGKLIRRRREDGRIVNFPPAGLNHQQVEADAKKKGSNGTKITKKLEEKRNKPETKMFKEKIVKLFAKAEKDVTDSIKRDLSAMMHMPFYKERHGRVQTTKTQPEIIKSYAFLLLEYGQLDFSIKLLKEISRNQKQTFRECAPKFGSARNTPGCLWEHAIPTKVIVDEIIKMLTNEKLDELDTLLEVYQRGGQRRITPEEDKLLSKFKASMPDEWDWRAPDVDPLARYKKVGIIRFHK
jgi:hypothetical protein